MTDTPCRARRLRLCVPLTLATLGVLTAACGGGCSPQVASLKQSAASADGEQASGKSTAQKDPEDAFLDFAKCMREHGIDMPDPETSTGAGGGFKISGSASASLSADSTPGVKIDDGQFEDFQKANDACKDLLGDTAPINMTPEQTKEMQDNALKFSQCMRDHGVDMPDPQFQEGGGVMMALGKDGLDPFSKTFQDAQAACGSALGAKGAPDGKGGPVMTFSGPIAGSKPGGGSFSVSAVPGGGDQ